ncbi:MAG: hypothetical protein AB1540_10250, partial [Bdellovibrionota bacterium]
MRLLGKLILLMVAACANTALAQVAQGPAYLNSSLQNLNSITQPAVGPAGQSNLAASDFVSVDGRTGASFTGARVASFPLVGAQLNLNRGNVEFWYRPNYDAGAGAEKNILTIGAYNGAPRIVIQSGAVFALKLVLPGTIGWRNLYVESAWQQRVWRANQWVHIRAIWDNTNASDSVQLYLNGARIGASRRWMNDWSINHNQIPTASRRIFVGAANGSGVGS